MNCHICEEHKGMHFCSRCKYPMCPECAKKVLKEKDECPHCKNTSKIKYFLAGKMQEEGVDMSDNHVIKNYMKKKIIVRDNKNSDFHIAIDYIVNAFDIDDENVIDFGDYYNTEFPLPENNYNLLTKITGPAVVIKCPGWGLFPHGTWCDANFSNICDIPNIVNKRNFQMIKSCDVFSLKINNNNDCFRSLEEWGMAVAIGKIPILIISSSCNPLLHEHYLKAVESIEILETLSEERRNAIFYCHPDTTLTYSEYKLQMQSIIGLKEKKYDQMIYDYEDHEYPFEDAKEEYKESQEILRNIHEDSE